MNSLKPLLPMSLIGTQDMYRTLRPLISLNQIISVRFKPCHPRIRGHPRPPLPGRAPPEPHKYNWRPIYPPDGKYTVMPLKIQKLAGRDPETGRVVVKTLGGGLKKYFRWIDYKNAANEDGTPFQEKVFQVRYDPLRSSKLALVAGGMSSIHLPLIPNCVLKGDKIRWKIASETMESGDVITTYSEIPRNPIRPKEGDSHPVGALPIGTKVHNVEVIPGEGGTLIRYAGDYAEVIRRAGKKNYLHCTRSKQDICIDQKCMVTVGRVSNPYHHLVNRMCPQKSRWLGKRPRSGAWHRKDGYCGKKNKPPKALQDYVTTTTAQHKIKREPEIYVIQPFD